MIHRTDAAEHFENPTCHDFGLHRFALKMWLRAVFAALIFTVIEGNKQCRFGNSRMATFFIVNLGRTASELPVSGYALDEYRNFFPSCIALTLFMDA